MAYYGKGGFNCVEYLRSHGHFGGKTPPPAEAVSFCSNYVKDKDDPLSCLYWFKRCICCQFGDCDESQKARGMGKGKCSLPGVSSGGLSTSETYSGSGVDIGESIKNYWWIGAIGGGLLLLLILRR